MTKRKPKKKVPLFQERILAALKEEEVVILQAPTGSGKTEAALAPFLQRLAHTQQDQLPEDQQ